MIKDHLMRDISNFIKSMVNHLLKVIEKGNCEEIKMEVEKIYSELGKGGTFFLNKDIQGTLKYLKENNKLNLDYIYIISELMFAESNIRENKKKEYLNKSLELLRYYISNSKEYSIEIVNRLKAIENFIITL